MLSEYFHPLSFYFIILFILQIFLFDAVGSIIVNIILKNQRSEYRVIYWIIGLFFFVFVWFLLRFFIPPTENNVLISLVLLIAISIPIYLNNKYYKGILKAILGSIVPIIVISIFLPAVFVKASLPPYYWDEMAYQFISPAGLENIGVWKFTGGLYDDIPKSFNLHYILSFAVFKSYSIARLTHFAILASAIIFAYRELKGRFGFLAGFLFALTFFSIDHEIVLTSTLGYIDVATYSTVLIAILFSIRFISTKNKEGLFFLTAFWAIALGIKYTPLTAFLAMLLPLGFLIAKNKSKYKHVFTKKTLSISLLIFIIFGGYWYIKNFIVFGNPIFPMVFPCLWGPEGANCGVSSSLFAGWTTPITVTNYKIILGSIFPRNYILIAAILISPILAILSNKSERKKVSLILISAIIIELCMLKYFSGFYARYHQHVQVMLILIFVLQINNKYKSTILNRLAKIGYPILILTILFNYFSVARKTNSLQFLNGYEVWYAMRKVTINDWVKTKFPKMNEVIFWCQNPPGGKTTLVQVDPDMIWYEYEGLLRIFLIKCNLGTPEYIYNADTNTFRDVAIARELQFYIASINECTPDNEVKIKYPQEADEALRLRKLNNMIVCNSNKEAEGLYYFDYNNLIK